MECRVERAGRAVVFAPEGRIDSAGALRFDAVIRESLGPADRAVIFDMAGVSYMSSAGIRVFSALEKTLRGRGGHLCLYAVQLPVAKVLEITGFNRIFTICPTRGEALQRCSLATKQCSAGDGVVLPENPRTRLAAESLSDHPAVLKITGSGATLCKGLTGPEDLTIRIFSQNEYSVGFGAPGESVADSFTDAGTLLTLGGAIFWKPSQSSDPPDFLVPRPDAPRVLLNTAFSVIGNDAFHEIFTAEPACDESIGLSDLFSDIAAHAKISRGTPTPVFSIVIYAGISDLMICDSQCGTGTPERVMGSSPTYKDMTLLGFGVGIDMNADLLAYDREQIDSILCQKAPGADGQGMFLYLYGLVFDAPPSFTTRDLSRLAVQTAGQESCIDLVRLQPGARLSRALLGISYITGIEHAERMPVRIVGDCPGWNRTYEAIARFLHPGCQELELHPLSGGFSGTLVFRVKAKDSRGASMMPLVMKLGTWPQIEDEISGYTGHVKRYIQNNATQVIETERIGDYGGILYNFVGIRGPESRIFSLEDFYCSHTADEVLPVFDALFSVVLSGWYREPRKKEMALYRDYGRFWNYDGIRAYAAEHFGATPDQKEIELPFGLKRSINPIWFVETVMKERADLRIPVYESSVHGDLNMKNVLMDETGNLWLIDFAETRYSHILRDIVKLEAVLKGEMTQLNSRADLAELVQMDLPFVSVSGLSEIPELTGPVNCPAIAKTFRCVQKLREHADRVTNHEGTAAEYCLALLPFTLNLLSYSSVSEYQREYGWIASSLLCRRLMETGTGERRI